MRTPSTLSPPLAFASDLPLPSHAPASLPTTAPAPHRLVSLDAYRGLVMLLMASGGLALAGYARSTHAPGFWQVVGRHVDHIEWRGCYLWDLIQPSFTFIVGVALPFSLAKRR